MPDIGSKVRSAALFGLVGMCAAAMSAYSYFATDTVLARIESVQVRRPGNGILVYTDKGVFRNSGNENKALYDPETGAVHMSNLTLLQRKMLEMQGQEVLVVKYGWDIGPLFRENVIDVQEQTEKPKQMIVPE